MKLEFKNVTQIKVPGVNQLIPVYGG